MRSIVLFLETLQDGVPPVVQPVIAPQPVVPITTRLSPTLINYMKKDSNFADEVNKNLKNYETMALLKRRQMIHTTI